MKNKIISLHGSYFGNNYGDILLVNIFAQWIKEVDHDLVINMPWGKKSTAIDLQYDTTGFANLLRSKALVFCGGGYFGEQPLHHYKWAWRNFWRHGVIGLLAILFKIPYVIVGVEFGPISANWFRKICIYIAKHAQSVVVRNRQSYDFLVANGIKDVQVSADAVLSLSDIYKIEQNTSSIKHIIVHNNGLPCSAEKYKGIISNLVASLDERFDEYDIIFVSDSSGEFNSNHMFDTTFELLKEHGVNYRIEKYKDCNTLVSLVNSADFIITTKLHVGITSAALNKRVLSLWLHNKTPRLHAQIGNADNCVEFKSLNGDVKPIFDKFFSSKVFTLPDEVKQMAILNKNIVTFFVKSQFNESNTSVKKYRIKS